MSWYYSRATGRVFEATGLEKVALDTDIMVQNHGGLLVRVIYGPYSTQAEAQAAAAQYPTLGSTVTQAAGQVGGTLNPLNTADAVFAKLAPFLVRVGEVVAGIVLLAIAANVILKQTTGVDVAGGTARAARRAASAVPK